MSISVTFDARDALAARERAEQARRHTVRAVSLVVVVALVAIIAVPMPLEWERRALAAEAADLGDRVAVAEAHVDEAAALRAECAAVADPAAEVERWFAPVPDDDVAWLVELVATRCGVEVDALDSSEVGDPLALEAAEAPQAASRVLGVPLGDDDPDVSVAFDEEPDDEEQLDARPFAATRWTLDGRGDWTSIVMLAGLLGASDAPLRVREVSVRVAGDVHLVRIVADRLRFAEPGAGA